MKKIINKSLYNTDTARCVGQWDNGHQMGDFTRADEDLYQTRSGKYFLHGYGGPMSTYAVHHGNSTSGGEQIIPMTAEEARQWAEENLTADEYQEEFGPVEEADDAKRKQFPIQLKPSTIALLRQKNSQTGMTLSDLVEVAVLEVYGS